MKFLKLLTLSLLFVSATYAQDFKIVSTYPANGENVEWIDSVSITFNQKIDFSMEELDTEFSRLSFLISPEDSVDLSLFTLSEDSLTAIFYVDYTQNTNFIGIIDFAVSMSGDTLSSPYIFNFSTYPTPGEFVVEGSLPDFEMMESFDDTPIIITLGTEPLYLGPTPQNCTGPDQCEPMDDGDEDEDTPTLYATFVDLATGTFSIPGVREGTYYIYGFDFYDFEEDSMNEDFEVPDLFYYDPDENLIPNPIIVSTATTIDDTLTVELSKLEFIPITLSEAIEIAEPVLSEMDDSAYLVGGITHYGYYGDEDSYDDDSLEAFKAKSITLSSSFTSLNTLADDEDDEDLWYVPSGLQYEWNLFGYDASKDSAFTIVATPLGAIFGFYLGKDDANIPDEVAFTDVAPLPDVFIDSDSAAAIMEANGGSDFRSMFEESGYWVVEMQALNNFWDVNTDTLIENLPVMWSAQYYGFSIDVETFEVIEGMFEIFLDIETGEVIHSRFMLDDGYEDGEGITFAMALDIADSVITSLGDDAVIAGGSTYYYSNSLFEDDTIEDPLLKQKTSQAAQRAPKQEAVLDYDDTPDGYQYEWMIYGYDATKDSLFSIYVDEYGAEFEGYVDRYQANIPDSVALEDILELPDTFIDSDSAVALIEMYGGEEFRYEFSDLLSYWEMDLEALNNFWELNEDTLIADAPVMWSAEYYGLGYDYFTDTYFSGYLIIYIDMETGELIYSRYELDEYDFSSHITFDEAVDLADSLLSTLPNDQVLFGGYTNYNNEEILFKKTGKEKIRDNHLLDSEPGMVSPDGYAYSWELYYYDSVLDSMIVLNVTEYDAYVTAYLGEEDLDEPLDFSDVLPLPSPHIDSDSAAAIISMYGADEFLESKEESELYWTWDYDLSLFHHYWDFPLDPTPSAPITWKAELYAWAWDDETEEYIEDSLLIHIDAETGDLLVGPTINANDSELDTPMEFSLLQNYPNPFNPSTNIPFELSEAAEVTISVYSLLGQKVATLVNGRYQAGQHSVQFNAQNLASGVYVYRMEAKNFSQTRKLLLVK